MHRPAEERVSVQNQSVLAEPLAVWEVNTIRVASRNPPRTDYFMPPQRSAPGSRATRSALESEPSPHTALSCRVRRAPSAACRALHLEGSEQRAQLVECLFVLGGGVGVGDDPTARVEIRATTPHEKRSNHD